MPVNFFDPACQEPPANAVEFGIVDDQNGQKARTDLTNPETWVATVKNHGRITVTFTGIDNCLEILRPNGDMDNRCDGLLTYPDNLVFIELKDQRANWISDAINQLESSIRHFRENHDLHLFRHKRAFACNKRHPHFAVIDNELMKRFYDQFGVRLNLQVEIQIR